MESRHQISAELQGISPFLAQMELINPYIMPTGYFETLPNEVMDKITTDQAQLLLGISQNESFLVPMGYFEGLSDKILYHIQQNSLRANEISRELETVAPLLNSISPEPVFTLPPGYFDKPELFISTLQQPKPSPVFHLKIARRWMQYAAAAMVAGVLVTGAFLYTDNSSKLEYEKYEMLDIPSTLHMVTEEELVKYLDKPENSETLIPGAATPTNEETLGDVKNTIQLLTDEELNQYLLENAESSGALLPTKNY